jgi:hypothetical protein
VLFSLLLVPCQLIKSEQLPVKNYTTADGLPQDQIIALARLARLRFCTEEGLSRFDGYKFTNYTTAQGCQVDKCLICWNTCRRLLGCNR